MEEEKGTDLWKCTHQCSETQGNNSAQALLTKMVFFRCKKRDRPRKEAGSKEEGGQKGGDVKKMLRMSMHTFVVYLFSCAQRRH